MIVRLLYQLLLQRISQRNVDLGRFVTIPNHHVAQRNLSPVAAARARKARWWFALAATTCASAVLVWVYLLSRPPAVAISKEHAELKIQVSSGNVWPLVVYLRGDSLPPPDLGTIPSSGKIESLNNVFFPRFQILSEASEIEIFNSDQTTHNTHVFNRGGTLFNVALPMSGITVKKTLTNSGVLSVRCDHHPWMKAWIFAPPSAHYAIFHEPGSISFSQLPADQYVVHVWQPGMPEQYRLVNLSAGAKLNLNLR